MKFADVSYFEAHILPPICLFGLMATIAWGAWCSRRDRVGAIRAEAFEEAGEALRSLSAVASNAADCYRRDGWHEAAATESIRRGYYYNRAAQIVRSIPATR